MAGSITIRFVIVLLLRCIKYHGWYIFLPKILFVRKNSVPLQSQKGKLAE